MKPFSPRTLAEYWGCSERKIRKMCDNGELDAFKIGVMWRITYDAVKRYECSSKDIAESGAPTGGKTVNLAGFRYVPPTDIWQNKPLNV